MVALIQCGWFLIEKRTLGHTPREDQVKTQRENGPQSQGKSLLRNQPCRHLDFGLLAFRIVRA